MSLREKVHAKNGALVIGVVVLGVSVVVSGILGLRASKNKFCEKLYDDLT